MLNNHSARSRPERSLSGSVPWRAVPRFDFLRGGAQGKQAVRTDRVLTTQYIVVLGAKELAKADPWDPKAIAVGTPRKKSRSASIHGSIAPVGGPVWFQGGLAGPRWARYLHGESAR